MTPTALESPLKQGKPPSQPAHQQRSSLSKKKTNYQTNMYFSMNRDVNYLIEKSTASIWAFVFYRKWRSKLHVQSPHYACLTDRRGAFQKGLPELTYIVQNYRMSKIKVQNIDQQQGPHQIFSNHRRWGRLYIPYLLLTTSICYSLLNFETI